jgi:hypothetical protein
LVNTSNIWGAAAALKEIKVSGLCEMQKELLPETGISTPEVGMRSGSDIAIEFWENFNLCWLALGQYILDNVDSKTMLLACTEKLLEDLANYLIRLCDSLEGVGLVDYQMGVWEEEILHGMTSDI